MSPHRPVNRAAAAGSELAAVIVLCGAIGLGIGLLVGAVAVLTIAGVFAGVFGGLAFVYTRYRDL